mmetsp:Transcript_80267/g.233081  ORF Transcript_80267/g.233081 Transcript_80267/m.233081 type:complete len:327 (-) Transcript_80267:273-1253(-)
MDDEIQAFQLDFVVDRQRVVVAEEPDHLLPLGQNFVELSGGARVRCSERVVRLVMRHQDDSALVLRVAQPHDLCQPLHDLPRHRGVGLTLGHIADAVLIDRVAQPRRVQGDDPPLVALPSGVSGPLPRSAEAADVEAAEAADEVVIPRQGKRHHLAFGEGNSFLHRVPVHTPEVRLVLVHGADVVHVTQVQRHVWLRQRREPGYRARRASARAPIRQGGDGVAERGRRIALIGLGQWPPRCEVEQARRMRLVGREGLQWVNLHDGRLLDPLVRLARAGIQVLGHLVCAILARALAHGGDRRGADTIGGALVLALPLCDAPPATTDG